MFKQTRKQINNRKTNVQTNAQVQTNTKQLQNKCSNKRAGANKRHGPRKARSIGGLLKTFNVKRRASNSDDESEVKGGKRKKKKKGGKQSPSKENDKNKEGDKKKLPEVLKQYPGVWGGKRVCFNYNLAHGCAQKCHRGLPVCIKCHGSHPLHERKKS